MNYISLPLTNPKNSRFRFFSTFVSLNLAMLKIKNNMKNLIYSILCLVTLSIIFTSCSNDSENYRNPKFDIKYYFESGDNVLGFLEVRRRSSKVQLRFDDLNLGFSDSRIKFDYINVIVKEDSLLIEKESYDKYGELVKDTEEFVATFDENGILNDQDLINFLDRKDMVSVGIGQEKEPIIDKITIKE